MEEELIKEFSELIISQWKTNTKYRKICFPSEQFREPYLGHLIPLYNRECANCIINKKKVNEIYTKYRSQRIQSLWENHLSESLGPEIAKKFLEGYIPLRLTNLILTKNSSGEPIYILDFQTYHNWSRKEYEQFVQQVCEKIGNGCVFSSKNENIHLESIFYINDIGWGFERESLTFLVTCPQSDLSPLKDVLMYCPWSLQIEEIYKDHFHPGREKLAELFRKSKNTNLKDHVCRWYLGPDENGKESGWQSASVMDKSLFHSRLA